MIQEGIADLQCRSDIYLIDEFSLELEEHLWVDSEYAIWKTGVFPVRSGGDTEFRLITVMSAVNS